MAVSSSMSVSSAASAPVQVPPSVSAAPATSSAAAKPLDFSYHNYEDMTTWLKQFSASNPDLTALYSIGKSVQGEQFISFLSCLGPIVKWLLALRRLRLSSSQSTYFCYCNLKLIAADPAAAAGWTKLPLFFSSSPFEKTKRKKMSVRSLTDGIFFSFFFLFLSRFYKMIQRQSRGGAVDVPCPNLPICLATPNSRSTAPSLIHY